MNILIIGVIAMVKSKTKNNNQENQNSQTDYQRLAQLSAQFSLLSSLIVNSTKEDNLLIDASIISLIGDVIIIISVLLEAYEQQIAPGITTYADSLKIIGTIGALIFALILFKAQLIEVSLKNQSAIVGIPPLTAAAGTVVTV